MKEGLEAGFLWWTPFPLTLFNLGTGYYYGEENKWIMGQKKGFTLPTLPEDKIFEIFIVGGTKTGDYGRERNEFRNQEG